MLLNATPFNGDLLGSYESPTISAISARNAIQQPWEKDAKYIGKVQWLFVVMFSTYFLPKQMNQNRQCKNVHEVQFIPKTCFPMMFSIYVLKSLCFFLICFATPVLQNHMNDQGNGTKKNQNFNFPDFDPKYHEKKMQNTLAKSNDFSSWCFRPIFCPSKWTKIVNVKTCTKSNLSRKRVFQWCSRYMF